MSKYNYYPKDSSCRTVVVICDEFGKYTIRYMNPETAEVDERHVLEEEFLMAEDAMNEAKKFVYQNFSYGYTLMVHQGMLDEEEMTENAKRIVKRFRGCIE